jgi:phosphate regulon transcriptional regulatory protein phoB
VCGDLVLDRVALRVFLKAREVTLTPKASMLLDYLMTHPGELHTRERLLAALWGIDFASSTRAVDHRIREIRRVLGDDPTQPTYIETVPSVGYRFIGAVRA